ncbi:MAG: cell division protein FtsA [Chloroflexi bacterium]|nr:cell division protein FtsA [Chloroflexota bacterium]
MYGVAMDNSRIFAAIDIGTSKILTIIGKKLDGGRIEVLGHGEAPCSGVRKGVVEDVEATQFAVKKSVSKAESSSGMHVDTAFVGITGRGISYERRMDTIDWVGEHGVVTYNEVAKVPSSVRKSTNGYHTGREIIHAIPNTYSIDGKMDVSDPMGMHTSQVDVETHLVKASSWEVDKLTRAVEGAGVRIESLVLESLASCESVLTQEERFRGAALVDIGGGTTDVMVFQYDTSQYSSVIPIGGYQFTNDICVVYNTTYEAAEEVKVSRATALPNQTKIHEEVTLPINGGRASTNVSLHDICQLTRERAQELIQLIVLKLREGGIDDLTNYRIVLSGGASKLDGFHEVFKMSTGADVRVGAPPPYLGMPRELRTPMASTAAGILAWAAAQYDDDPKPHAIGKKKNRRQQREFAVNGSGHKDGSGSQRRSGILSIFRR